MHFVVSATLYFGLTYAAGFVLGTVREVFVAPRFGSFAATAIEAPLMLIAMVVAARYVIGRNRVPPTMAQRLAIGGAAFGFLMLAEIALSGVLRAGRSRSGWNT